jgi:predicted nucleic acid-binding protein
MLVVDASCLYEVLTAGAQAETVRARMSADGDLAAPHIIDVEVFGIIRKEHLLGRLDRTAASQAVDDLRLWSGERLGHKPLLGRAWELRDTVRGWDAMYVALAELLGASLLTFDQRLSRATGPRCTIELC